jgi:glycosyltransferase involved in cell wall biosynthesis
MRILQVNCFYEKVGGAEVYMHLLADELRSRGHEVAIFAGSSERPLDEPLVRTVKREEYTPSALVRDPEVQDAFTSFARAFRPDLIHVHNMFAFPTDFVDSLSSLGVPVVQSVHDFNQLCPNSWNVWGDGTVCEGGPGAKCFEHSCGDNYPFDARKVLTGRLRYQAVPKSFDAFLCPSQFLADKLTAHGYPHAEGLPLWVDVDGLGGEPSDEELASERDPNRVVFIGRLVKEKGVRYLVEAVPHLRKLVPDSIVSIVGGGPEEEALHELGRKVAPGGGLEFVGRVPHEQVRRYFLTAACQALPSIWCENSPVSCYESYLLGLPMVASRIAGLPAMVREGETGLLAEPRNPVDLAEKLARVLTDDELRAKLSAGCRESVARFSRDRHLDRMLAVYDEVLARGPQRPSGAPPALDPELVHSVDATVRQLADVEEWALGMKGHIDWLEETGQAGQPVQKFGRHLVRILKQKLR